MSTSRWCSTSCTDPIYYRLLVHHEPLDDGLAEVLVSTTLDGIRVTADRNPVRGRPGP